MALPATFLLASCEGTQCKRAPHKAHTSLCNVDYAFINFHGILNIKYNAVHFPLQKIFFLFSLEWPVLYVTRMTYHVIYVSLLFFPTAFSSRYHCSGGNQVMLRNATHIHVFRYALRL